METPNGIAGKVTSGSGNTAEDAEFQNGAQLARQGKELPEKASDAAKAGFDSVPVEERGQTTAAQPGTAGVDQSKSIIAHKVAPQAQTDRPEPTTLPSDAERLNPNDDVSVTIDAPGKVYLIEGRGASVKLDFENDLTPESVIACVINRLQGGAGETGATDQFARNAVKDLEGALDKLHQGTREKFKRFGVTQASGNPLT